MPRNLKLMALSALILSIFAVSEVEAAKNAKGGDKGNGGKGKTKAARTVGQEAIIDSVDSDGAIHATGKRDRKWLIRPEEGARLVILGTADPAFLKVGQTLQFAAELNDKDQPTSPVADLTIADSGDKPQGVTRKKPPKDDDLNLSSAEASVVGRITSVSDGRVVLKAGRKTVAFDLDPKAVIHLLLADRKLIVPKSKILFTGKASRGNEGTVNLSAESVEITLTPELTRSIASKSAK